MAHYNTTNESGTLLELFEGKAATQEELVLKAMQYLIMASPSFLCEYFYNKYPITSIRRALTDLTRRGKLVKTAIRTVGPYGRAEFCWRLAAASKKKDSKPPRRTYPI